MKRNTMAWIGAAALGIGAAFLAAPASAQNVKVNFKYTGAYVWRGMDRLPMEEPAFQPSVEAAVDDRWTLGLWGSYGLDSNKEWDEFDYTMTYRAPVASRIAWTAGVIYYDFQHNAPDSVEVFGGLDFNAPLHPSLRVYGDFDEGSGWYAALSARQEFPWGINPSSPPLVLKATLGLNDGQWGTEGGLSHIDLQLSRTFPLGEKMRVTPALSYTLTPGDKIGGQDNVVWLSAELSMQGL